MAAVPTLIRRSHQGTVRVNYFDITLAAYVTGGLPLTFQQLGFTKAPLAVDADPVNGRTFRYDAVNQKLMAFTTAATEQAAGAGLDGVVVRVQVEGTV